MSYFQVFPPSFRELPPPPLELFDLDEAFSSVFTTLTQFTNKYVAAALGTNQTDVEIVLYVQECAKILKLETEATEPKDILYAIGVKCAQFKSVDSIK